MLQKGETHARLEFGYRITFTKNTVESASGSIYSPEERVYREHRPEGNEEGAERWKREWSDTY